MYASQTKRLCVRESSSDETRVQHRSTTSEANNSGTIAACTNQQLITTEEAQPDSTIANAGILDSSGSSSLNLPSGNMTASASSTQATTTSPAGPSKSSSVSIYHNNHDHQLRPAPQQQELISAEDCPSNLSSEHELINRLAQETIEETRLELLLSLRNLITACNKKRDSIVINPNFSKLIELIENDKLGPNVKAQIALLLCSIAKSGENNIKFFNQLSVDDKIIHVILSAQDGLLIEACFRCLRSIMSWPGVSRTTILYDNHQTDFKDKNETLSSSRDKLFRMIQHAQDSNSLIVQECVADIFSATCTRSKDQFILYRASAVPCIAKLLESPSDRVVVAALNWMTQMSLKNHLIASEIINTNCPSGSSVLDRLAAMMSKDKHDELQFLSARAYAHLYKALATEGYEFDSTVNGSLRIVGDKFRKDSRLKITVLSTLVRMIHKDKPSHLRVKSAECLAYLIEGDPQLQYVASVCDHLIRSLASMLDHVYDSLLTDIRRYSTAKYRRLQDGDAMLTWLRIPEKERYALQARVDLLREYDTETTSEHTLELRRAAFVALAALASELETIRKRVLETCSVMQHLVKSLSTNDIETLKAALTCLLSLSRSVQELRTTFAESNVYGALKGLLGATSNEVLILVLAVLCNVSLEFSDGKQHFLDESTIETLCNFTKRPDPTFRLHGMWTLMNMVYQLKDLNLKLQILRSLGIQHVVNLLKDEETNQPTRDEIILKTLGFLRNSLSQGEHVDTIMGHYGEQILNALVHVLERPCKPKIKEQTLCVLTNIADGKGSKALIMNDKFILSYLAKVISECDGDSCGLRLAAICCITNLAYKDFDKSRERRHEMNKFGIEEKLKSMLSTSDHMLSDRVRTAYNQFLD